MKKRNSLKRKVFNSLLLPISLAILGIGIAGFYSASSEVGEVYDAQLITAANVLWALTQNEAMAGAKSLNIIVDDKYLSEKDKAAFNENADGRMFRLWNNDKIIISSEDSVPAEIKALPAGFSDIRYEGDLWRIYSLHVPAGGIIVEVGEELAMRHDLVNRIVIGLVIPLLLVLPAIALLVWRGVGQGLIDVEKLSRQVKKRSPEDLSPLITANVPVELLTLAESLNTLLYKLEESFLREKRFTENAAHELRTPLAALKIQAQLALSAGAKEVRGYLEELISGVDRASKLVEELLSLAQSGKEKQQFVELDLYKKAAGVVERLAPFALEKDIEITLREESRAIIKGSSDILTTLIGNILDNAIKYTGHGGKINVLVTTSGAKPVLEIIDNGPGIPESEYEKVFERFYRKDSRVAGSGLGLAIARNMAENIGAEISLKKPEPGSGLRVVIIFNKS